MAGARRDTILLIDNDKSSRQLLRLHLANAGYHTLEAEDAVTGGRLLIEQPPDLVILEANLPFLTGLDLIATIAVDQSAPCLPVVFLASNDEDRSRAQQLGDACLIRPFFADELLRVVRGLLSWPQGSGATPLPATS
jgi:two-component system, chemotaxis family, chemotaxis protein CheY